MSNTQANSVQTKDVTEALKFFIELSMVLSVDAEGYVYSTTDAERKRIKIGAGDQEKPVVVYQEVIPKDDVYVINPFAEGLGDRTPPQVFFYKLLRAALNARVNYTIDGVMAIALEQHKLLTATAPKKGKEAAAPEVRAAVRIVDILARKVADDRTVLDEVDEKMLEEFHKFYDQHSDRVIELVYKPSLQRTDVLISVIDEPGFIASLHNMRKKSIAVLQTVLRGIFDVGPHETFEKFNSKRIEGTPSKLSSWLQTMFLLYHPLNEVIDALPDPTAPDHLINLDIFQHHLEQLPAYTSNAKWMMVTTPAPGQAATTQPAQTPGTVPHLTPAPVTLGSPGNPGGNPGGSPSGSSVPPGYKLVPGAIMADGSVGPPLMLPDLGSQDNVARPMPAGMAPGHAVPLPGHPTYMQPVMQPPQVWQPGYPSQAYPPYGGMGINPLLMASQPQPIMPGYQPGVMSGYTAVPYMPPLR